MGIGARSLLGCLTSGLGCRQLAEPVESGHDPEGYSLQR